MTERDEPLVEGMKIDARNYMRHNPRVWHEALEEAIDKYLPPLIEAVRQEERENTLRDYAQNRYLAFLEHPEVPWLEQPEGTARQYAKVAADMIAEADRIREQGKEQDR